MNKNTSVILLSNFENKNYHIVRSSFSSVSSGPPSPPLLNTKWSFWLCLFSEFVQTAWEDIERFKEQKDKDLREALISYAIMQISMCKKVWDSFPQRICS